MQCGVPLFLVLYLLSVVLLLRLEQPFPALKSHFLFTFARRSKS